MTMPKCERCGQYDVDTTQIYGLGGCHRARLCVPCLNLWNRFAAKSEIFLELTYLRILRARIESGDVVGDDYIKSIVAKLFDQEIKLSLEAERWVERGAGS